MSRRKEIKMKRSFRLSGSVDKFALTMIAFVSFIMMQNAFAGFKLDFVTVKTRAPENKEVKIWYRVPANYNSESKQNGGY